MVKKSEAAILNNSLAPISFCRPRGISILSPCIPTLILKAKGAEVALAKKRFEMARFDLVHHLNQLETRKKHEVVDR